MASKQDQHSDAPLPAGIALSCSHCGGTEFTERSALLNTRGLTWLGLDWLNEGARVFACSNCGHLEWFVVPGGVSLHPTAIECLSCGASMSADQQKCSNCEWSYEDDSPPNA